MRNIKKLKFWLERNLLLVAFFSVCFLVGIVAAVKFFYAKPTYIYIKVKVGQGLWWAATQKPDYWFVKSIKKGEAEVDLMGRPQAEILGIRYYPVLTEDSYPRLDIFVNLRLKTSYDEKNKRHLYKRDIISVGSPVEFQFPSVNITGTITDMSDHDFTTNYVEKTIYLYNFNAYQKDFPFIYDNIKVGDRYFNGQETVFTVTEKELLKSIRLPSDIWGRIYEQENDTIQHILVKAKIKLKSKDNQLIYGEERPIKIGEKVPFITDNFNFENFWVVQVE